LTLKRVLEGALDKWQVIVAVCNGYLIGTKGAHGDEEQR
jgi:hypothetical protein